MRLLLSTALLGLVLATSAAGQVVQPIDPTLPQPDGVYSYAVKMVCGFNNTNTGVVFVPNGTISAGEPSVKLGNYATEVNIFNPGNEDLEVTKKWILLVREGVPIGREPKTQGPFEIEQLALPLCQATMDDCNHLAELIYGPLGIPTPLPLFIGYLVVQAKQPLDVTAVYTAEVCSDWVTVGGARMCSSPANGFGIAQWGGGLSIDVEQIEGRFLRQ